MDKFLLVARQVLTLFVLIGVGAGCRLGGLITQTSVGGLVNLLVLVVTPCLIVTSFQRPFQSAEMRALLVALGLALAIHGVLILLSHFLYRQVASRTRSVLRLSTVFSNAGFMGLPLEQALLGARGVFFGVVYVAVFNLLIWSWGVREMRTSPEASSAWTWARVRLMVLNPGTLALLVGLSFFLMSYSLPALVKQPLDLLAQLNTPLAMVVIGFYLAGAAWRVALRSWLAWVASFVRLVACPLFLLAVLWPFRAWLDRTMMLALLTASSAPVAAMVTMFAAKYERDVDLSVGLVSVTTLVSMVTMPSVLALAMMIL